MNILFVAAQLALALHRAFSLAKLLWLAIRNVM
jgi:hypothetical protein